MSVTIARAATTRGTRRTLVRRLRSFYHQRRIWPKRGFFAERLQAQRIRGVCRAPEDGVQRIHATVSRILVGARSACLAFERSLRRCLRPSPGCREALLAAAGISPAPMARSGSNRDHARQPQRAFAVPRAGLAPVRRDATLPAALGGNLARRMSRGHARRLRPGLAARLRTMATPHDSAQREFSRSHWRADRYRTRVRSPKTAPAITSSRR